MKIAIVSLSGSNSQHNCVTSLLKCLLEEDNKIDFYLTKNYNNELGISNSNLTIIQIKKHPFLWSLFTGYLKNHKQTPYDYTIFLDNASLILFPFISLIAEALLYFQLEITDRQYCYTSLDKFHKFLEIYSIPKVRYLITQDLWRAAYVSGEFKISIKKIVILPNSPIHTNGLSAKNFIRNKYGIKGDMKIVGYIGMIDQYTLPEWLIEQMTAISNVIFFFHTHKPEHPYFLKVKDRLSNIGIVSTNFYTSDILQKCYEDIDIGLALGDYSGLLNKYTTINQELSGYSYGKINWYLSFGKPVVYTQKISLSYLQDFKCGLAINCNDSFSDIIHEIINKYDLFSLNCLNYYKLNLSFEKAYYRYQEIFNEIKCMK